jgi:hypothetical protein
MEDKVGCQWAAILLLSLSRGKELEVVPGLDFTLSFGADGQGCENGQNASVGNPECDPAEGDHRHRRIIQCNDSKD